MLKKLGKESILYAIGTLLQRIATLLLVPIYTSHLTEIEFGALETLNVFVQTLIIILNFGLSSALLRYYVECKDEEEVALMVRTSSVMVLVLSTIVFLVLIPIYDSIGELFFGSVSFGLYIILAFVWAIGGALNRQLFSYYRARQEASKYVLLSLVFFLLLMTINITFVRILNMKLSGVLLGNILVIWCTNLWVASVFWRRGFRISRRWASTLFNFGFPLVFSMAGWLLLNSADRYFLAYYRDLTEVGLYSLGYRAGMIVQIGVVTPFQLAWGPFVFSQVAKNKDIATQNFSRVFTYLILIFCFVGLGLVVFSKPIIQILGSGKFQEASSVIPYVVLAYLFNGVYYWAASFFHLMNKNKQLSAIVFLMAGVNLLLNWLWIPELGWVGAAWSTVITIGATGLITLIVGEYYYPMPLEGSRLIKILIGTMIGTLIYYFIQIPENFSGFLIRAMIILVLPSWLILSSFLENSEVRFLLALPKVIARKLNLEVR